MADKAPPINTGLKRWTGTIALLSTTALGSWLGMNHIAGNSGPEPTSSATAAPKTAQAPAAKGLTPAQQCMTDYWRVHPNERMTREIQTKCATDPEYAKELAAKQSVAPTMPSLTPDDKRMAQFTASNAAIIKEAHDRGNDPLVPIAATLIATTVVGAFNAIRKAKKGQSPADKYVFGHRSPSEIIYNNDVARTHAREVADIKAKGLPAADEKAQLAAALQRRSDNELPLETTPWLNKILDGGERVRTVQIPGKATAFGPDGTILQREALEVTEAKPGRTRGEINAQKRTPGNGGPG